MLNIHVPGIDDATGGCTRSKTGLCKDCPLFVQMPCDVRDANGQIIRAAETVFECADVWAVMGAWDTGNQAQLVHAAVNQLNNETVKRQDEFLSLVKDANNKRRLSHADGES